MVRQLVHRELGLDDDELEEIVRRLGREPTYTELAMFSVMWSEHCSYKSSRLYLGALPSSAPHVLVGPGEGAGVVEVAPGVAVAWKIESHNHPSFVEPVNGAATGVGGIVRDIVSMGARPIALLDSLRFGSLEDAHTRYLVDGVTGGISSYGNSIGVPTVGGEAVFDEVYGSNPLVNVACLGIVEGTPMRAAAEHPGNVVVLFGASTGRDGIGGASVLASATFDEDSGSKRPSVQVGDPLAEKLLIEVSLELLRRGLVQGLQDLGAGGISCPSAEMAAKAGTGIRLEADAVALREQGMEPYEIMISESQERMMAVVDAGRVPDVLEVCRRWGVEAGSVGRVTSTGRIEVVSGGETVADVAASDLAGNAPLLDRPAERPAWLDLLHASDDGSAAPSDPAEALLRILGSSNVASKRWIWEQYDHMIFLGTVVGPGGDATVIRLPGREVGVALSVDGPGRTCWLDPYEGARLAVAEAARNVAVTGARPLAVTNCLNLGNPERPEAMWQFKEIVRGVAEACEALGTPVVGGNVSFYNETDERSIFPTPVIGMLGALPEVSKAVGHGFRSSTDAIVLLGETEIGTLAGSEYAKVINDTIAGRPLPADLNAESSLIAFLEESSDRRLLRSAHDVSCGGLAVCLVESAVASDLGFSVSAPGGADHRWLFSESAGRVVVTCAAHAVQRVLALARRHGVPAEELGRVGGATCDLGIARVTLEGARRALEDALPAAMDAVSSR